MKNIKSLKLLFNNLDPSKQNEYKSKIEVIEDLLDKRVLELPIHKTLKGTISEKKEYVIMKQETTNQLRSRLISKTEVSLDGEVMHQELEEEMLNSARVLKQSSIGIQRHLYNEQKIVDSTTLLLQNNLDSTTKENKRLKEFTEKSSKSTLFIWIVVILCLLITIGTFLFMKIFTKR